MILDLADARSRYRIASLAVRREMRRTGLVEFETEAAFVIAFTDYRNACVTQLEPLTTPQDRMMSRLCRIADGFEVEQSHGHRVRARLLAS